MSNKSDKLFARRKSRNRARLRRVSSERPRLSVLRFWRDHPGRFAQGPDEKKGARGRAAGRFVM